MNFTFLFGCAGYLGLGPALTTYCQKEQGMGAASATICGAVGGGLLLGVKGVVVIGHGRSDSGAVFGAIQQASQLASHGIVAQLEQTMAAASAAEG